jgi:hypothetical protein
MVRSEVFGGKQAADGISDEDSAETSGQDNLNAPEM